MPKVYFVFPIFNEVENIPQILIDIGSLKSFVAHLDTQPQFIFVDDGSRDGTADALQASPFEGLKILRHEINQGPGAAFETAFDFLYKLPIRAEDLVITLEGDATSNPTTLKRMLKRLEEGDDMILASPYTYGGGFSDVSYFRLFISNIANFLFKLLLGVRGIGTFSCFYRIYRGRSFLRIKASYPGPFITRPGFECAAEVVLKAVRCQVTISEVPFKVDWSRRKGRSKMRIFKTTLGYFALMLKYSLSQQPKPVAAQAEDSHS